VLSLPPQARGAYRASIFRSETSPHKGTIVDREHKPLEIHVWSCIAVNAGP
jgi:hypothetical protein